MKRLSTAMLAGLAALSLAGSATGASAHGRDCGTCGPIAPTTHYRTVHPSIYRTRVRDVSLFRHVQKIHRVTYVTQVQPVVHLHIVTRVHHHTIVSVRDQVRSVTEHLSPVHFVTRSTQNFYDCGCSP